MLSTNTNWSEMVDKFGHEEAARLMTESLSASRQTWTSGAEEMVSFVTGQNEILQCGIIAAHRSYIPEEIASAIGLFPNTEIRVKLTELFQFV